MARKAAAVGTRTPQTATHTPPPLKHQNNSYIPAANDVVIGVVRDRHLESFVVDVGGPFRAQLPMLSFENATRRNRPNLKDGDVVLGALCRVCFGGVVAAPGAAVCDLLLPQNTTHTQQHTPNNTKKQRASRRPTATSTPC